MMLIHNTDSTKCIFGDGRGGEGGAKSYDGEIAWSTTNHSILSGGKYSALVRQIFIKKCTSVRTVLFFFSA
jgi:hypothetical protein